MALTLKLYSASNATTKTVTVDFAAEVGAFTTDTSVDNSYRYFINFKTTATDTSDNSYNALVANSLDDLALNGVKQSATDTNAAYTTITALIQDYLHNYINGNTADQFSSGVAARAPMDFS